MLFYSLSLYLSISPFHVSASVTVLTLAIKDKIQTKQMYTRQIDLKSLWFQQLWIVKKCGLHQIFTPTLSGKMKTVGNAWPFSININESSCWGKPDMRSGYSQDALQILLLSIFHYTHSMTQAWAQLHMVIFLNAIKCFVHKCWTDIMCCGLKILNKKYW